MVMRHEAVMEAEGMVRCSCGSEFDNKQDWEAHVENAFDEESRTVDPGPPNEMSHLESPDAISLKVSAAMKVLGEYDFLGIRHLHSEENYEEYIVLREGINHITPMAVHRMLIRRDGSVSFEQGDYFEADRQHEAWERFYKRG